MRWKLKPWTYTDDPATLRSFYFHGLLESNKNSFVVVRKELEEWMVVGQVCNQGHQKGPYGSGPGEEWGAGPRVGMGETWEVEAQDTHWR